MTEGATVTTARTPEEISRTGAPSGWGAWLASEPALVIAAFALAVLVIGFSEKIQTNGGFGDDGVGYGNWVRGFVDQVLVHGLNDYLVQRIVPSGLVAAGLRILRIEPVDASIINGFVMLNTLAIGLMGWMWPGSAVCWGCRPVPAGSASPACSSTSPSSSGPRSIRCSPMCPAMPSAWRCSGSGSSGAPGG